MPTSQLIKTNDGAHILLNNSQPFYIKGAGLEFAELETFAAAGGNTFRTWRVDNGSRDVIELLDEAQRLGLSVCMGLDLARERHGFDYSDPKAVKAQTDAMMHDVERLKDHPALFMWGLGNELNLRAKDLKVWNAVDQLAQKIKAADPNHLVTTMLAGIDKPTIEAIKERAPSLDLLSFQIYGEIDQLPQILKKVGYTGPYQVTEWGPTGHWESPETAWKRHIEPSSHDKAKDISRRYNEIILRDKANCLGSYIFLWGQKQERTPTWYGVFLENGFETESVDVMHYIWNSTWPENRTPQIQSFKINNKTAYDDVILEAKRLQLYSKLINQLNKDFLFANIDLDFDEDILPTSLKYLLHETIFKLIQEKFSDFLNLLYIIDVPERQVKEIDGSDALKLAEAISFLILKREWQKVWFRNNNA